jgi:hypothetical protein
MKLHAPQDASIRAALEPQRYRIIIMSDGRPAFLCALSNHPQRDQHVNLVRTGGLDVPGAP